MAAYTHLSILASILESVTFGTQPELPRQPSSSLLSDILSNRADRADRADALIYSIPTLFLVCLISTPYSAVGGQGTILCQICHINPLALSSLVDLAQFHSKLPIWLPNSHKLRHWCFCRITKAVIRLLASTSYPVETPILISLLLNNDWIWELAAPPSETSSLGPFLSEIQCERFAERESEGDTD